MNTIALPYGLLPIRRELALQGSWDGESYRFAAAFLAGAEPSPSPAAGDFEPLEIPRIRTTSRPPQRLLGLAFALEGEPRAALRVGWQAGHSLAAQAAEDGKGVLRHDLPDELAACLDLAVDALGEGLGLLAGPRAHDDVRPAPYDVVAVRLQLVCESVGLVMRGALHTHFPGGEAAGNELLLDVRLVGLRVPAVLLVEPVLEDDLVGVMLDSSSSASTIERACSASAAEAA